MTMIRFGWEGDRQVAEEIDGQLTRTTVYEPESFVPLARIEMRGRASDEDDEDQAGERAEVQAMLAQVKHMLLSGGLALPKELLEAQQTLAPSIIRIGWFHTDHLGTPLALTDEKGKPLWYGRPDDWGAVTDTHGSVSQRIRFQGQYYDPESGLYYNRHRYYDPAMGRYVSQDPIGLVGGINLFAYVGANPASGTDPLGLVDLNLFGPNDPVFASAAAAPSPPNTFTVGAHGNPSTLVNQNGVPLTPAQLWQYFPIQV